MPRKGRGHGSVEFQAEEGLAALRAVNRMPWRRKGMDHLEAERGGRGNRLNSSSVEFESLSVDWSFLTLHRHSL